MDVAMVRAMVVRSVGGRGCGYGQGYGCKECEWAWMWSGLWL